ncbi:MAG: hypothetical protein M5R36_03775 [Deltaproteobacteria bacterium]|nr:hypothetical protein [Deltaproteobacteria bacterium]
MDAVVKGFRAPLSGIRFLFAHPRLVRYFAVPVAINTASYIAVAYVFFANLSALLHWIFGDATVWYMQILFYAAGLVDRRTLRAGVAVHVHRRGNDPRRALSRRAQPES